MGMLFQAGHPEAEFKIPDNLERSNILVSATPTPLVKRLCPQIAMQSRSSLSAMVSFEALT